jgi:hypothetical protein
MVEPAIATRSVVSAEFIGTFPMTKIPIRYDQTTGNIYLI